MTEPTCALVTLQAVCVMQHLVSVSIIGSHDDMTDDALSSAVHQEMSHWFGAKQTDDWKLLRMYRVPFAQPNQVGSSAHGSLQLCLRLLSNFPFSFGRSVNTDSSIAQLADQT